MWIYCPAKRFQVKSIKSSDLGFYLHIEQTGNRLKLFFSPLESYQIWMEESLSISFPHFLSFLLWLNDLTGTVKTHDIFKQHQPSKVFSDSKPLSCAAFCDLFVFLGHNIKQEEKFRQLLLPLNVHLLVTAFGLSQLCLWTLSGPDSSRGQTAEL